MPANNLVVPLNGISSTPNNTNANTMFSGNKFSNIQLGGTATSTFNPIAAKGSAVSGGYNNYTIPYSFQPNVIK